MASVRKVADAVAELAYRAYEHRIAQRRKDHHRETRDAKEDQGWSFLSNKQQLEYIKAAHRSLDLMPPRERMGQIDELATAWVARPRNNPQPEGRYGKDTQIP